MPWLTFAYIWFSGAKSSVLLSSLNPRQPASVKNLVARWNLHGTLPLSPLWVIWKMLMFERKCTDREKTRTGWGRGDAVVGGGGCGGRGADEEGAGTKLYS